MAKAQAKAKAGVRPGRGVGRPTSEPAGVTGPPIRDSGPTDPAPILTQRGERTRSKLVVAARAVFEDTGFLEARVADIADTAAVAHGTFYTYFDSKLEVFQAVIEEMMREITPVDNEATEHDDPHQLIAEANEQYFRVFQNNKALFAALDQVGSFDPQGQNIRRELRHGYERVAYNRIRRWQLDGMVDRWLDPRLAAIAVTALVGRFTQVCLAFEPDIPERTALAHLNHMYALALGIRPLG